MLLSEIGTKYKVRDDYEIEIPEGDYLAISVPVEYGSSASKFDHPNIAQTRRQVLGFKHYPRNRRKFWTYKPGLSYLFIVPKDKIELDTEKSGLSYVHIKINGHPYCLSVSGGGDGGLWTDYISQGSSTFVYRSAKNLKAIADAAVLDILDVDMTPPLMTDEDKNHYVSLCAFHDSRQQIKEGDKLYLGSFFSFEGSKGPFTVIDRPKRKRYFRCSHRDWGHLKIKYSQIDWTKTARENGYLKVS